MTSFIMTLLSHPRKVITLHGKQNGGSRKFQELKMEPEYMSGEEFLRSIEARLDRMEEMANAFHDYQIDCFRRELGDKQLRQSIAKTTVCCNKSQNNGSTENDETANLLKIYDPDRETELVDVFRYQEYSEELETIEEMDYEDVVDDDENACNQEFASKCKYGTEYLDWLRHQLLYKEDLDKRYDDQVQSNQKFAVEFKTGAEYLQWLELQLPYVEHFQHQDETHYYFFRKWRKDDLKYYSNMECLDEFENEDDEDEIETDASDLVINNLKPIDEETKPEFDSGRQLVEWLGRRLAYVEPFAPNDAVHFYFKRRWSREKFVASVDVLEEVEIMEETAEEQVYEAPQIEPDHSSTEDEDDVNVYISLMTRPVVLDGFKLEKKTQEPEQDTPLPVEVNKHLNKERIANDESLAVGSLMKPMKDENESTEEKKVKKHQKKGRNFLRRLFGR